MANIQKGELGELLRQFFNVAGALRVRLDETIFGTVALANLDKPPYRIQARLFHKRCTRAALAANFSGCGIHLPLASRGAAVVTGITFENSTAAAQQLLLIWSNNAEGLTGYALAGGCVDCEQPGSPGASTLRLTPVREFTAADVAIPGGGVSETVKLVELLPDSSIYMPFEAVLYPGFGLSVWSNTLNTIVGASFDGEYHADASQ